jgi:hypothetical protein
VVIIKKYNMEIFKIEVKETLSRIIEVEADSIETEFSLVQDKCKEEVIVLDYADFVHVEFLTIEE